MKAINPPGASRIDLSFSWSIQALVVTTLGGDNMGQRVDNLTSTEDLKRFYLQVRCLFLDLVQPLFLFRAMLARIIKLQTSIVGNTSINNLSLHRNKKICITFHCIICYLKI